MTAHKAVILECDTCGALALPETMILLDLIHVVGRPTHSGDARSSAHRRGWTHTVRGKDLCRNCKSDPRSHPSKMIPTPREH